MNLFLFLSITAESKIKQDLVWSLRAIDHCSGLRLNIFRSTLTRVEVSCFVKIIYDVSRDIIDCEDNLSLLIKRVSQSPLNRREHNVHDDIFLILLFVCLRNKRAFVSSIRDFGCQGRDKVSLESYCLFQVFSFTSSKKLEFACALENNL